MPIAVSGISRLGVLTQTSNKSCWWSCRTSHDKLHLNLKIIHLHLNHLVNSGDGDELIMYAA